MRTNAPLKPGQHAIITGGSSGLGYALADEFLKRGLRVTLVARRLDQLETATAEPCAGATPRARCRLRRSM